MKIVNVDHVSISVKNMDETLTFYTDVMGVKKSDINDMTIPGVIRMVTINTPGAKVELLQFLDANDPLAKFANSKADGIHHMAVKVDDIVAAMAAIKKQGGTLLSDKPGQMPSGMKVAFVLPKNSQVLIELLEG